LGLPPVDPSVRRLAPPARPCRSFGAGPPGEKSGRVPIADPPRPASLLLSFRGVPRDRLAIRRIPAQSHQDSTDSRAAVWRFDAFRLRVVKSRQSRAPSARGGAPSVAPSFGRPLLAPIVLVPRPGGPPSGWHRIRLLPQLFVYQVVRASCPPGHAASSIVWHPSPYSIPTQ
jgi:hypothetical protein